MKVAVYHTNFCDTAGGAEIAAFKTVKALREQGHEVDLYTSCAKKDIIKTVAENSGFSVFPKLILVDEKSPLINFLIKRNILVSYQILQEYKHEHKHVYKKLLEFINDLRKEYDIVISMQVPSLIHFHYVDIMPGDIMYLHYPTIVEEVGIIPLLHINIPNSKFPLIKLYKKLILHEEYNILRNYEKRPNNSNNVYLVAVNSSWTKERLIKLYSILSKIGNIGKMNELIKDASIVYPPIDYEAYASMYDPSIKKDLALTVSRYCPGKNLKSIIYVASKLPNVSFVIVGSTKTPGSQKVISQLETLIDELKLKNVSLEKDVPKNRLIELYSQAKVYLHPLFAEHFGIAIAEGAAAGAVPVVYRDGGGWMDIASRIDPMLGYSNIDEASKVIKTIIQDKDLWLKLSKRSVETASSFSWSNYKLRLNNVVQRAFQIKTGSKSF